MTATGGTVEFLGTAGGGAFPTGTYSFFNVQIDSGTDPGMNNQPTNQINAAGSWTFIGTPASSFGIPNGRTWNAGALFFDATQQASGTWGNNASAATNKNNAHFPAATTGVLNVASSGATKFVITGSATQTAGTSKDAGGATAVSYTGDKSLTFTGANSIGIFNPTVTDKSGTAVAFGNPETITFVNGVATVSVGNNGSMTLYKAETANTVATQGGITTTGADRLTVVVSPAAASQVVLSGSNASRALVPPMPWVVLRRTP